MESTKPTDNAAQAGATPAASSPSPASPPPRKRVKPARSTKLMGRFACAMLAAAFACYVTISNPVLLAYGTPAVAGMTLLGAAIGFFVSEMIVMVLAVMLGILLYALVS